MILFSFKVNAQLNFLEGNWQGILVSNGQQYKDGFAMWFNFEIDEKTGDLTGDSRIEVPFSEFFAYKSFNGKASSRIRKILNSRISF